MATAATACYIDPASLPTLTTTPTDTEKANFANAVADQLKDGDMVAQFQENVKEVGIWANQIDASFDRVTRSFADMVTKYGKDFPGLAAYNAEWISFNTRWVQYLATSRDVASESVTLLRRFDQIFLDMVESIVTDQDREDVIKELQSFIDEKHDRSVEMQSNFLTLKRDIVDFVARLDQFIIDKGIELDNEAKQLKLDIEGLESEITILDKQIKDATIALSTMGGCLNLIGVVVAGSVLASYKDKRRDKKGQLHTKQAALADVKRKQEALGQLKADFAAIKPDITLICEKLVLFAEIWSSVRSQTVQFQEQLKGGMGALSNIRFKAELRLARSLCGPLQAGLEKYATELETRNTQA